MTKILELDRVELEESDSIQGNGLAAREQTRACPECGNVYTLRGLYGHLRLAHKKTPKEIGKLATKAKVAPVSKMEEVFALLDRLNEIDERFDELEDLDSAGAFTEDGTCEEFWETLEGQEREVVEQLKRYGISRQTRKEKLEAVERSIGELKDDIKKLKGEKNKPPAE